MKAKYENNDVVIYDGVVARILSISEGEKNVWYGLSAVKDSELECTALQSEISDYEEDLDDTERINEAYMMREIFSPKQFI